MYGSAVFICIYRNTFTHAHPFTNNIDDILAVTTARIGHAFTTYRTTPQASHLAHARPVSSLIWTVRAWRICLLLLLVIGDR
jgi:hypothetical protein